MPTSEQAEYMAFPRILAMSEVVWTNAENKNYEDFVSRVENFHKRLDVLDINYANHLFEINGEMNSVNSKSFYKLETLTEGKDIRYTLDGNEPTVTSQIYRSQIPISKSLELKAAVFNAKEQLGQPFIQNINFHKAVGAKITIDKTPHKAYSGSGAEGLINGINGSNTRFGDKEWLGFSGDDIEVTIDFGEVTEINRISTRFHNGNGQWIYAPKQIYLEFIIDDGSIVTDSIHLESQTEHIITEFNYDFVTPKNLDVKVKQVTLKIPNYGTIEEGKQGSGNKAWTFIDEIIVN